MRTNRSFTSIFFLQPFIIFFLLTGCSDFIEIPPPRTDLVKSTVFTNDETAKAAMTDIYYNMHFNGFASGDSYSLTFLSSLSSDEQIDYTIGGSGLVTNEFYTNSLTPANFGVSFSWSQLYSWIYKSNAIIEGLSTSTNITPTVKKQLEGEAKFVRAFCYFYLVNLWGEVPLTISTDYQNNASLAGHPQEVIYQQVITDLKEAQLLLADDYSFSKNLRTKPNRWTATALLARAYLYMQDWPNAVEEATKVINNSAAYHLEPLNNVFNKTSSEVLWQLEPYASYPNDIFTFYIFVTPPTGGALRPEFINAFEANDQRKSNWIGSINGNGGEIYSFATKYKSFDPLAEFSTVIRLAEVYLIRAEARAQLNDPVGSQEDLNTIRARAGLSAINFETKETFLQAIEHERRTELFCEWGHRWLDLKRTGRVDAVLQSVKTDWKPEDALFPIPESQVLNSPVKQTPGY